MFTLTIYFIVLNVYVEFVLISSAPCRGRWERSSVNWLCGSFDFPRSLCFMCICFGLEILRLVLKKRFFKYWKVTILFDLFTSKKIAPSLISWISFSKLGALHMVSKEGGILRWFQKCIDLLRQEVLKDFFLKCLKNQFYCKNFPFAKLETSTHFWNQRKISLLLIPFADYFEEILFQLL